MDKKRPAREQRRKRNDFSYRVVFFNERERRNIKSRLCPNKNNIMFPLYLYSCLKWRVKNKIKNKEERIIIESCKIKGEKI